MKKRFAEEKIISLIKEQEAGVKVEDLCRQHKLSPSTF